MEELTPCHGPLCPLTALYGGKTGRALFAWLQQQISQRKSRQPSNLETLNQGDAFLIHPIQSSTNPPALPLPHGSTSFTGLHLTSSSPSLPLAFDWPQIAHLGAGRLLMLDFPLYAFSAEEYRQLVEDLFSVADAGVPWLKLDASQAPLWQDGTPFVERLEAHGYVQLIRRTLDVLAPQIRLAAGEIVSQGLNFSFFGGGGEADLVENTSLAPLLLYTMATGQVGALQRWVASLQLPFPGLTFYNTLRFDGRLSINAVSAILEPGELQTLESLNLAGKDFLTALANLPGDGDPLLAGQRLQAALAVLLALTGVPGFDPAFMPPQPLLQARGAVPAFSPHGAQLVFNSHNPSVFSLLRIAPDGRSVALCFHNASLQPQEIRPDLGVLGLRPGPWQDIISKETLDLSNRSILRLPGSQALWLIPEN